MRFTETVLIVF